MPWKETKVFNERKRFIDLCLSDMIPISTLCREFGISRTTAYKYIQRYSALGENGLIDISRAPHSHPNSTSEEIIQAILLLRQKYPHRGAPKLKAILERMHPDTTWPAESTIGKILKDNGFVPKRRSKKNMHAKSSGSLTQASGPCTVWSADYKGDFRLGCGKLCYPLTITDSFSRMILSCRGLASTSFDLALPIWITAFREFGLPDVIRTDNGSPFASIGIGGISRLSAWWIKLGITPERIKPGSPQQNGRHENMHRTLKAEAANPPKHDFKAQQKVLDWFADDYNNIRPHESLGMATPASVFVPSAREYPLVMPTMEYPSHVTVRRVRPDGRIKWQGRMIFVSEVLIGEPIALDQIEEERYALYFGPMPLAILDNRTKTFLPHKEALPIILKLREESQPNTRKV